MSPEKALTILPVMEADLAHARGQIRELKKIAPTIATPGVQVALASAVTLASGAAAGVMDHYVPSVPPEIVEGTLGAIATTSALMIEDPNLSAGFVAVGMGLGLPALHNISRTGVRTALEMMEEDSKAASSSGKTESAADAAGRPKIPAPAL